jgi:hypothetical protein
MRKVDRQRRENEDYTRDRSELLGINTTCTLEWIQSCTSLFLDKVRKIRGLVCERTILHATVNFVYINWFTRVSVRLTNQNSVQWRRTCGTLAQRSVSPLTWA